MTEDLDTSKKTELMFYENIPLIFKFETILFYNCMFEYFICIKFRELLKKFLSINSIITKW